MDTMENFSKESGTQCCVSNCLMSRRRGKRLFKFNEKRFKLNVWLEFCNLTIDEVKKKKLFICEDHFDSRFLSGVKLAPNAIPTKRQETVFQNDVNMISNNQISNFEPAQPSITFSHSQETLPINSIVNLDDVNFVPYSIEYLSHEKHDDNIFIANLNSNTISVSATVTSSESNYANHTFSFGNSTFTSIDSFNTKEEDISSLNLQSSSNALQHLRTYSRNNASHSSLVVEDLTFQDLNNLPDPYFDRSLSTTFIKTVTDIQPSQPNDKINKIRYRDFYQKKCARLEKLLNNKTIQYKSLYRNHNSLKSKYVRLKQNSNKLKKMGRKTIQEYINGLPNTIPNAAKTISGMILQPQGSKRSYTEDEKVIAQNLCFRSNKVYNFMRETLKIHLPSKASINNWLPLKHITAGFNKNLMERLSDQFYKMSINEKQSILMFDEIVVRNDLKFDEVPDKIEGFVDLGSRRELKIGNYVQVFMIRGIFSSFKYYLSYFVSEYSMKGQDLIPLLFQNLSITENVGAVVRVVVCDQGSGNCKTFNDLGVSVEKPYFMYGDRKIYAMYDPPHLIKSIRNALINNNFLCSDGTVSWDVIRELHDIDKNAEGTRACLKLTSKHVNPGHFDKMKVRYAVQVFSNSVSDAIKTMDENNLFKKNANKKNAQSTAKFIKKINNMFDCLNSNCVSTRSSFKTAYTITGAANQYLPKMINYLSQIKISNSPPVRCILGLQQSISAFLLVAQELISESNIQYIFARKFNQDSLENGFAQFFQIRNANGHNRTPSVSEFSHTIGKLMSIKILPSLSQASNCEEVQIDDRMLCSELDFSSLMVGKRIEDEIQYEDGNTTESDCYENECGSNNNFEKEIDFLIQNENLLEANSRRYFAGYVLHMKIKVTKCENCKSLFVKSSDELAIQNNNSESLINNKNFFLGDEMRLNAPSDIFCEIVSLQVKLFLTCFSKWCHKKNLKQRILEYCSNQLKKEFPEYFNENFECFQHLVVYFEYLIIILIRKHCKFTLEKMLKDKKERKRNKKSMDLRWRKYN